MSYRRQEGYTKQVPYREYTNISRHCKKLRYRRDFTLRIRSKLYYTVIYLVAGTCL